MISIHASAKEATGTTHIRCYRLADDFNPRLREGGDHLFNDNTPSISISIHASAKEATFAQNIISCFHFDFNPRLREGGDKKHYRNNSG